MSVIVVATIFPLEEHRADVVSAHEQLIAQVHAEDGGCELYALHEGDDRLVMIEKWASAEALAAHGDGAALKTFISAVDGKLKGAPDVQILRPHPTGSADKGAL